MLRFSKKTLGTRIIRAMIKHREEITMKISEMKKLLE